MQLFKTDSEVSERLRRTVLAVRNVSLALACVFAFAQAMAWTGSHFAYSTYYDLIPGQYNGHRLAEANALQPENTCLILGASTAREGFDIGQIEKLLQKTNLVTLATSAGKSAIWVIDVQSRSIPTPAKPYKCIVIAMHPFFIYEMASDRYQIENWDYDSQLPLAERYALMVQQNELDAAGWRALMSDALLPNAKHADILEKHLRRALYDIKSKLQGDGLKRAAFEIKKGDLERLQPNIRYADSHRKKQKASLDRRIKWLAETNHADPARYQDPLAHDIMVSTLQRLSHKTERLIVLDMPATPVFDTTLEVSRPAFEKSLRESDVLRHYYRCSLQNEDRYLGFVDSIHVDSNGRAALSASLAAILAEDRERTNICKLTYLK